MIPDRKRKGVALVTWALVALGVLALAAWATEIFSGQSVVAESRSPAATFVLVREIPRNPSPIEGLFGLRDYFYRCEFYWSRGGPLYSCQSYVGGSGKLDSIRIRWSGTNDAYVAFDGVEVMVCRQGVWSTLAN